METLDRQFLSPANSTHRQYEALRAHYVDRLTLDEAARRFGYSVGTFRNLCAAFRKQPDRSFFLPDRRGRRKPGPEADRDRRIVELRIRENLSVGEIARQLTAREHLPVSTTTVARVLRRAGLPKLWRRAAEQRGTGRPEAAATADRRALDLTPRRLRTDCGGLFLFAADLARLDLDGLLAAYRLPGSAMIPAGCAVRALLALKLWGGGRPSLVMPETLDEGLALFAGLNTVPKPTTLAAYSGQVDPRRTAALMDAWHHAIHGLGVDLGGGRSFDLDFHTIPHRGADPECEKHGVSRHSRPRKGILTFLARDADARLFAWADATQRKDRQHDAVLRFVESWQSRTGARPRELVFDGRLTTYANLARLQELGIAFLTLRRRSARMTADLLTQPPYAWRRIALTDLGRRYRTPRVLERTLRLAAYPGPIRQLAVRDLGHDQPALLLTNQMDETPARLVDRYVRRVTAEITIADAVDFFHTDALSAAVPMKIDLDVQLTLMADALYRLLGRRLSHGLETATPRTLFRKLVRASATVEITADAIVVTLGRRAQNPLLLEAGYADTDTPLPWLDNRTLRIRFG